MSGPASKNAAKTLRIETTSESDNVKPCRTTRRSTIALFVASNADSVISVRPVPAEYNPKWVYWRNDAGSLSLATGDAEPIPRRQDLPPAFHRDGSVYVVRTSVIMNRRSLYGDTVVGYEMPREFSANIDTEEDWTEVEQIISARNPVYQTV